MTELICITGQVEQTEVYRNTALDAYRASGYRYTSLEDVEAMYKDERFQNHWEEKLFTRAKRLINALKSFKQKYPKWARALDKAKVEYPVEEWWTTNIYVPPNNTVLTEIRKVSKPFVSKLRKSSSTIPPRAVSMGFPGGYT